MQSILFYERVKMDKQRKKELREEFSRQKSYMGVIQITNTVSGRIFIDTASNLKNRWYAVKMQLDIGRHVNKELQKDWNDSGADAFEYKVLEEKEIKADADNKRELAQMIKPWLDELSPFGERGYNKPPKE